VEEEKRSEIESSNDPIIQSILQKSLIRQQTLQQKKMFSGQEEDIGQILFRKYNPKYDAVLSKYDSKNSTSSKVSIYIRNLKMRRIRGTIHCIALKQPLASNLVAKEEQLCFIPWKKQLFLRGPIIIAALNDSMSVSLFNGNKLLQNLPVDQRKLPKNALIGRAFLKECITWREYKEEYTDDFEMYQVEDNFVLVLSSVSKLPNPVAFECNSEFFELDGKVTSLINQMLDTDSLFDEFDFSNV